MDLALRKAQEDYTESYLLTEGLKLERELNAANERIKRLEESENRMLNWLTEDCPEAVKKQLSNAWMRFKKVIDDRSILAWTSTPRDRDMWLDEREHSTDGGKNWLPCGVVEEAK